MVSRLRNGNIAATYKDSSKITNRLYGSALGRRCVKILISPRVSNAARIFLDSGASRVLVSPFVRKNKLDLSDYPRKRYRSFNCFFTRTIDAGARPIAQDPDVLIAPCDGKLTLFPLTAEKHFTVKGCDYTLETLLRSKELSDHFCGGWGILFRLTVDDYHRYCYPVSGEKDVNIHINGVYHAMNPKVAADIPIYHENSREYTLIKTEHNGTLLMMEIGAMLVGRIRNLDNRCTVKRGTEKGYFEFGGSSIMLLLEKEAFEPDADLLRNSQNGEETIVKLGESVGKLCMLRQ